MRDPDTYLVEIEMALVSSPIVVEYRLIRSWANTDDGYIRVRATLSNGDFLEMAEYFIVQEEQIAIVDYRHQWMDATRTVLRRRWDNTPDHPELDSFPHHCHVGDESHVVPGEPVSLIQVLALIGAELRPSSMD
jgi:hypothetical protein